MSSPPHNWKADFMRLWWQHRRAQWDVWADGADRDVTSLDAQLYQLCRDSGPSIEAELGRSDAGPRRSRPFR